MIRLEPAHRKTVIAKALTTLLIALTCNITFARDGITGGEGKHHPLQPLLQKNALLIIPGNESDIGIIAVTDNIHYQNKAGNIHINKRPTTLSALDSVIITDEFQAAMKPTAVVIEKPPAFVMIKAGQSLKTLENELVTIIQDESALHAQVTKTENPEGCLTDTGCSADEIVIQ